MLNTDGFYTATYQVINCHESNVIEIRKYKETDLERVISVWEAA